MSDTITPTPALTPDEVAKARSEKLAARVAELKAFEGKTFRRKSDGATVKIERYDGVKTKDGINAHTFLVEGPEGRWTPKASEFLANHDLSTTAATATTNEPI
jgi:hypothetical protein